MSIWLKIVTKTKDLWLLQKVHVRFAIMGNIYTPGFIYYWRNQNSDTIWFKIRIFVIRSGCFMKFKGVKMIVSNIHKQDGIDFKSSHLEVFFGKGVLKICSKFTGEHPCRSVISIKLLCNFIEITLWHGCSPVNLLHIFRTLYLKSTSGRLFLWFALTMLPKSEIVNCSKNPFWYKWVAVFPSKLFQLFIWGYPAIEQFLHINFMLANWMIMGFSYRG